MSQKSPQPPAKPFVARITPPGSKSLSNRAMIIAAMGQGVSELSNVLFADDTLVMMQSLQRLGFHMGIDRAARTVHVHGRGGRIDTRSAQLFCGNSGTSIRFLAALCGLGHGTFELDGVPRMRMRPIGQLVDLLRNMAVRVRYMMADGYPPIQIDARGLAGGIACYPASQSSQFLSAVAQVAPYARYEVRIDLDSPQTSWPYVAMTLRLMDEFGVTSEVEYDPATREPRRLIIPRGSYRPMVYNIETDASNASYFLAAAAVRPGAKVTVEGLGRNSLQGDVGFADILHRMGADLVFGRDFITITGTGELAGDELDMSDMPDMAMTAGVVALYAKGPTTLRGLHTLRVKETDRVAALATELRKLGARVDVEGDDLVITPPPRVTPAAIDTYDDHRMAMSFAVAATATAGIAISDPECVNKTYPDFWDDLGRVLG